jgi:hypothetical protein|tara:strand:+ start:3212 stop:3757 length:546 start_codon:yes stop_codon:yes gene_type:complete
LAAKKQHYVNNKQFLEAITEWKETVKDAESLGEERPPVTDYIGECFLKIAQHLSFRPNFINYSYKEEMIGDGIENCLQYVNNFDPEKSKNPFSYFTQIIYYAFIRRIQKEKKQTHTKHKIIEKSMMATFDQNPLDDTNYGNQYMDYLQKNMLPADGQEVYKTSSSKKKETKKSLENFYEEK